MQPCLLPFHKGTYEPQLLPEPPESRGGDPGRLTVAEDGPHVVLFGHPQHGQHGPQNGVQERHHPKHWQGGGEGGKLDETKSFGELELRASAWITYGELVVVQRGAPTPSLWPQRTPVLS